MTQYCIVSAHPKGATNHLNSKFKMLQKNTTDNKWKHIGWKSIGEVCALIEDGHQVVTAELTGGSLALGAPVEVELRISRNKTDFKISDMPPS